MSVSSILDAVREGWNFIWPPCLLVIVLITLARILAPRSLKDLGSYLTALMQQQKKVIALLRVYGLGKFVGIIEAFVILFLLYVVRVAVPVLGNSIPGQMVYRPSVILVRTVDPESLVCALASIPGASVDTLEGEINIKKKAVQAKLGLGRAEGFFGSESWQEKTSDLVQMFNVSKALMLYAVVITVIEMVRKRRFLRSLGFLLLVLFGLASLAAYLFGEQAYAHEQESFALVRDARVLADLDGFSCQKIPTDQTGEIRKQILGAKRNGGTEPGWRLEFYDYYLTWLRTRLIPKRVPAERFKVYFEPYSPSVLPNSQRQKQMIDETAVLWRTRVPKTSRWDAASTISRLLDLGYILPTMVLDDDPDLPGALLQSNSGDGTYRFFMSPMGVVEPLEFSRPEATAQQKNLCPQGYFAEVEQLKQSDVKTSGIVHPYSDLRDLLIETEKLTCVPHEPDVGQTLVLGYKLARLQ